MDLDRLNHGGPPDPARLMHVIGECWPFAADKAGIWLLSGLWPLQTEPIAADGDVEDDIKLELIRAQMYDPDAPLHQTSSRISGPACVLVYIAALNCDGPVRSRWPDALPVSPDLSEVVGQPPRHHVAEAPDVRQIDVIRHGFRDLAIREGLGHFAFLLGPAGDSDIASALNGHWGEHLAAWTPTLYTLYTRKSIERLMD